jgi:hypothetical protein
MGQAPINGPGGGGMIDLSEEVRTLVQDIGSLRDAFRSDHEDTAAIFRMMTGKADHVWQVFAWLAEMCEAGELVWTTEC